jgi:hypothetical protein
LKEPGRVLLFRYTGVVMRPKMAFEPFVRGAYKPENSALVSGQHIRETGSLGFA